jgi:hypothetical protein
MSKRRLVCSTTGENCPKKFWTDLHKTCESNDKESPCSAGRKLRVYTIADYDTHLKRLRDLVIGIINFKVISLKR